MSLDSNGESIADEGETREARQRRRTGRLECVKADSHALSRSVNSAGAGS